MRRFIYIIFTVYFVNHMIRCSFHRIEEYTDKASIQILLNGKQCNADRFYDTNSVGGKCVKRILLTVAGITSVITPIFIMCILSIFLAFELRASRATSRSLHPKQNNAASALLLFLCFYVLAELPYVLLYGVGLYNPADFNALDEYTYTQVDIFIYSNMCVGIIVYCFTSSQYRKTVVDTFWWPNKNVVTNIAKKTSCDHPAYGSEHFESITRGSRQELNGNLDDRELSYGARILQKNNETTFTTKRTPWTPPSSQTPHQREELECSCRMRLTCGPAENKFNLFGSDERYYDTRTESVEPPEMELYLEPLEPLEEVFRCTSMTRSISLKSIFLVVTLYLLINIFHLIVLTRPSMRNLSVSNEMILIAVCGVLNGVIGVFKNAVEIIEDDFRWYLPLHSGLYIEFFKYFSVHSFYYYSLVYFHFVVFALINQIILWQIVYITFLRAAIVLNIRRGIKVEKTKLNMRRFIYTIFTIYFVNHMIRSSFHRVDEHTDKDSIQIMLDDRKCKTDRFYEITSLAGQCVQRILLTIAGITSVITPILIMCILSTILAFELRASRATSMSSHPNKNNAASALLLFLCFYVLAELPYVLLYGVGLYNPADFKLTRSISLKSIFLVSTLYLLINLFHLLILTRPSMRNLSVSNEMILIAVCGVVNGVIGVLKNAVEIIEDDLRCFQFIFSLPNRCKTDHFYVVTSLAGQCLQRILLTVAGITSVVTPILIMCILSIFLAFELRADRETSMSSHPRQNNAASALLLFLCFYVLAELPYVLLYGVGLYNPADFRLMGLCQSEEEKIGSQKSRAIDKAIRQTQSTDERTVKLLLLGAGECGKSTVLKQMRLLTSKTYTDDELETQAKLVFTNIAVEMERLIKAMPMVNAHFSDPRREPDVQVLLDYIKTINMNKNFSQEHAAAVTRLWGDATVKSMYEKRREYNIRDIGDNTEYFFENLDRIGKEDYVPNSMDILLLRTKTTGIVEVQFEIKKVKFRVFDVGGQRSERKKWIHCFEDVNAIIFIAALSEYNEVLFEDETTNRMVESMRLFESICNSRWFHNTNIILFLNKKDLFEEKIRHENIIKAFPEYRGEQNYAEAVAFIKQKFEALSNNPKKTFFVHETCATDTNQVQKILDSVISMIIQSNLHKSGLY
uniref:G-protein coupled receptors family 1 profile domain-containing protein n=1 Tax=Caenorhabditis japonica TaxID=281687 RepID=A0A8R1HXG8_CAEJA